ncbi:MAG: EamA family transporter [Anaerolineales bacterium]|nr:EamA family transporter [Anaerolineales bacterium]
MKPRLTAILQALFVVFLWATSWVFIKIGLQDIPPITFAGLRYLLASICLLLFLQFNKAKYNLKGIPKNKWGQLALLGLLFYAVTQGASFVALALLPAVTVNLIWNFSSVIVALLGIVWLSEKPTPFQWSGIILALLGAVVYFVPVTIPGSQITGLLVSILGIGANAVSSIIGRDINRTKEYHPLVITVVSMAIGAVLLLAAGIIPEGFPRISLKGWAIIIWLAIVNTAIAFTLWNKTLQTLSAVESSIINNTMLIWIPIFAVLFLGETITTKEVIGLVIAGIGTLLVQLRQFPKKKISSP